MKIGSSLLELDETAGTLVLKGSVRDAADPSCDPRQKHWAIGGSLLSFDLSERLARNLGFPIAFHPQRDEIAVRHTTEIKLGPGRVRDGYLAGFYPLPGPGARRAEAPLGSLVSNELPFQSEAFNPLFAYDGRGERLYHANGRNLWIVTPPR